MFDDLDNEKDAYVADTFGVDPSAFAAPAAASGGGLLDQASSVLSSVADSVASAASSAYDTASNDAAGVLDSVQSAAAGAYDSVSNAAAGAIDSVEGAVSSAYDSVSSAAGSLVADGQAVASSAAADLTFSPIITAPVNPLDPAVMQAAAAKVIAASNEAEDWIRSFLTGKTLGPNTMDANGATVMFGGRSTPLDQVVDTTVAAGRGASLKLGGNDHITADVVRRIVTEILLAAVPRVPTRDGHDPRQVSLYIQYTFTPKTVHVPVAGGQSTSDQPAHTLTGQITFEYHADNQSGLEVSLTGSATWFADDKGGHLTNQSGFTGVQVAWVWSFLDGAFQAGPQFQALAGASRAQQTATNKLEWAPTGQISAGGQVQYAVPGLGGHLLIGLQAGASGTAAQGAGSTVDFSAALTFTYKF